MEDGQRKINLVLTKHKRVEIYALRSDFIFSYTLLEEDSSCIGFART